jgi:molybdopterin molybdotransferase
LEFPRGFLAHDAQGQLRVTPTGDQGSGILSSMSNANCFIVLALDTAQVEAHTEVCVQPFDFMR